MKRNKKGFTIVELVIVIAVIAILAAVLIPTFTSLINKANISADQQAVRQMNTALAIDEAENGRAETVEQALDVLNKAGYKANEYIALADGYQFYWDQSTNRVVLYNNNGNKIEYPEDAAEKYKDYKQQFSLIGKMERMVQKEVALCEEIWQENRPVEKREEELKINYDKERKI